MNTLKAEKRDMSIKAKKLRLYNGNIQRIIVKMAEMYGMGYLFRRKVTKLKRNQNAELKN